MAYDLISPTKQTVATRDGFLDFAKGLAILLVVIGHTLQGMTPDFDDLFGFRLIYSFHMPLFAFLSGAATIGWVSRLHLVTDVSGSFRLLFNRLVKSVATLLLPFLTWSIVSWLLGRAGGEDLQVWLQKIINQPDYSLWFLPCIFWCIFYFLFIEASLLLIRIYIKNHAIQELITKPIFRSIFGLLLWFFILRNMPNVLGSVFANKFHGGLFLYFAIGNMCYVYLRNINSYRRLLPYIVFFALAPFWYRTTPYNINPKYIASFSGGLAPCYKFIVAFSGILMTLDVVKFLRSYGGRYIGYLFVELGCASLGIYAIHFYWLGTGIIVLVPIGISYILVRAMNFFSLTRFVFLGRY
jgi:fucose 4-O-acetylase-like acetyltransferase